MSATTLLTNASATGPAAGAEFKGGRAALVIFGTLATTTKLQVLGMNDSTWVDVQTVTAAGVQSVVYLPPGLYRISLSGGTPSGVYATLFNV